MVKAPFRSAEGDANDTAFGRLLEAAAFDGGSAPITLTRYPHVSIAGDLRVGEDVVIAVYLNEEPDEFTAEEPAQITNVSANWSKISVDVLVHSAELVFDDEDEVFCGETSSWQGMSASPYTCKVAERAAQVGSVQLHIQLLYQERQCGFARRTFQLLATDRMVAALATPAASNDPANALNFSAPSTIDSIAQASTLLVAIIRQSNADAGSYTHGSRRPTPRILGRHVTSDHIDVGDARTFAEKLLRTCPNLRPGDHGRVMQGIGEKVWAAAPTKFSEALLGFVKGTRLQFPHTVLHRRTFRPLGNHVP